MTQAAQHIICAIRGRPKSRQTVTQAIDLALATGARLTFFYVVDAEFHAHSLMGGPLSVIYRELIDMSEFLMLILCDRATRRGVEETDFTIVPGNVRKQLRKLVHETHAEILVMGRPKTGPGPHTFKPAEFEAFVAELEREGGLQVVKAPAVAAGNPAQEQAP